MADYTEAERKSFLLLQARVLRLEEQIEAMKQERERASKKVEQILEAVERI